MWEAAIVWAVLTLGTIFSGYAYNYNRPKPEPQTQAEWCMANGNHRDPAIRKLHAKYCDGI